MKRKNLLFVSLLSLLLVVPYFAIKAEENIEPAAAAYQCIKCGSHQVEWHNDNYSNWKLYFPIGKCPDGKVGYEHALQRRYYDHYLLCSACGNKFKTTREYEQMFLLI